MSNRVRWSWAVCVLLLAMAQRAYAEIRLEPSPIDVGNVLVGQMGMKTGMLSSTTGGKYDITIGDCSGGSGTFTVDPTNVNLNGPDPKTITVTYQATGTGQRNCLLRLHEEGETDTVKSFVIVATGQTPPDIQVTTPQDFGLVRYNDAALAPTATRDITVQNNGTLPLAITNVTIDGTNKNEFSITSGGTSATINEGNTRTWRVQFNPVAPAGPRSATITFHSNDPDTPMATVPLTGTSATAEIALELSAPYDIVPVNSSRTRDIRVSNTTMMYRGTLGVTRAQILNGNNWFQFSSCGNPNTDCTFSPALTITDMTRTVGVSCRPPADAGTAIQTAQVMFTHDGDGGTSMIELSCTAGSSNLAASTPTVDFGPLLRHTTTQLPLMATNSGNQPAPVYVRTDGDSADQFAVTATSNGVECTQAMPCDVQPGGVVMIMVTFQPTVEQPLSANLDIVTPSGGPSVTLSGKGIDRHIQVPAVMMFPDTFRNPGRLAVPVPLQIENDGEYQLEVMDITIDGDPNVWSLAEPFQPFTVPGLQTHDVMVLFTPTTTGKAPEANLLITSDARDTNGNDVGPVRVILSGNGKKRNVDMMPGSILAGETFAGVPVRVSMSRPDDQVVIKNVDDTDFTIREIVVEGEHAEAFVVHGRSGESLAGLSLPAGSTLEVDITFRPSHPGEFEATVLLYLDDDPLPQQPVPIRGTALFVDAKGGGGFGCATGRGHGGVAGVFVLCVLARKRRRR